ncbi:MAG: tRNA-dihydrouridine synthase family protein [Spirochaetaceae bacterium]|nr:tRNA-dihydrouridine synthase family protein [Spirochaetaceae bacterium]
MNRFQNSVPLEIIWNDMDNYTIKKPLLLAPMAEISHRALRELIASFGGCDEYYTEMISAGALVGNGPFESYYTDGGPCPGRVVYQLAGADGGQLAAAAAILDRKEKAGIDINMGCSAPAIARTGAGVRWMASPDRAGEMIRRVRREVKGRLSVKLRTGMEDDPEYLIRFCRRLESEGVERIALHPRTAKEKFKRRPRWEYVGLLRGALGIPVVGNGDVNSPEELVRRAAGDNDGVMIGRLAVRAPWIFAQVRRSAPALPERVNLEETALRFLELLARYQPREFLLSRARRFFAYFCDNLLWGTYVKNRLAREQELSAMARLLSAYFREHPDQRELPVPGVSPGPA